MKLIECKDEKTFFDNLRQYVEIPDSIDFSYKEFEIPKKSGGIRKIWAPNFTLKSIQKCIAKLFLEEIGFRDCVHAYVKKKNVITNAGCHIKKKTILKLDLDNFFPTITYGRIYGLFTRYPFCFNEKLSHKLTKLSIHDGKLPQGSPLSPLISNLICRNMDKEIIKLGKQKKFFYTRYSDDITISTKYKVSKELIADLVSIIELNGFKINDSKMKLITNKQRQFVTGIVVNEKTNLLKKYKSQIRAMLNDWTQNGLEYAEERHQEISGRYKCFAEVVRGKILYLKQVRGEENKYFQKFSNEFNKLASTDGYSQIIANREHILKSSCWVIENDYNQGSCTFITPQIILTALHNLFTRNDKNEPVKDGRGNPLLDLDTTKIINEYISLTFENLSIIAKDNDKDIALLKLNNAKTTQLKKVSSLKIRSKRGVISHNKDHILIGYPNFNAGNALKIQYGKILNDIKFMDKRFFEIEQNIYYGNCGGVLLSKDMKIVGVPLYGEDNSQNLVLSYEEMLDSTIGIALQAIIKSYDDNL